MTARSNPKIVRLLANAVRGGCDCSLPEMFEALELEGSTLEKVVHVRQFVEESGLELLPSLEAGEIETIRSLRLRESSALDAEAVLAEIRDETDTVELKGSLICDLNKLRDSPKAAETELRSEDVLHSVMKTIAAFLNCGGGILFIGVEDGGKKLVGIENDFRFLSEGKQDRDHWEIMLRDLVKTRFHDGAVVNDHLKSNYFERDGTCVARMHVLRRTKLSLLRYKTALTVYRRQGNRTVDVPMEQLEEFIEFRKGNFGQ
jgi:hypothetical protein